MIRTRSSSERRKSEAGAARRLGRIAAADLAPFALLGAVALGVLIVRAGPRWVAIAGFALLFGGVALWALTSVLWPGRADRTCPACGAEAVRRTGDDPLIGRCCASCGWRDDAESAWMIAEEEEDALEPLVLAPLRPALDTQAKAD